MSSYVNLGQFKSGLFRIGQDMSGQFSSYLVKICYFRLGLVVSGYVTLCQVNAG